MLTANKPPAPTRVPPVAAATASGGGSTATATAECSICCEALNRSTRKPVVCPQCGLEACASCVRRHILGSINEPHCMACRVPFEDQFLEEALTKKFVREDLRAHWEEVLFERQKALFPDTMLVIAQTARQREFYLLGSLVGFYEENKMHERAEPIQARIRELREQITGNADEDTKGRRANRPIAVCRCPNDACKGMIFRPQWRCGMCDTRVCKDCLAHQPAEDHVCRPEDVETRQSLLENTKPCPGCQAPTFKIDGCSQIWCVSCHTTWNWSTGERETGRTHNPHYFEWMRRRTEAQGQAADAAAEEPQGCVRDDLPDTGIFLDRIHRAKLEKPMESRLMRLLRCLVEIEELGWRRQPVPPTNLDLENLRIAYLKDNISKAAFQRELYIRNRRFQHKRDNAHVYALFYAEGSERLWNLFHRLPSLTPKEAESACNEMHVELKKLGSFCNRSFREIKRRYGSGTATIFYNNENMTLL